jgi:hypothetical protein
MYQSLILFICADNDLSDFVDRDLSELKSLKIPQFISVDQRYKSWSDRAPNSYRIVRDATGKEEKTTLDQELNTGDSDVLREFILWAQREGAELEYSALVFWGHGDGWIGCARDYLNKDRLSLEEIRSALEGFHFRSIGFDACIMASLEVLDSCAGFCENIVASQEVEPKEGWNYQYLDVSQSTVEGSFIPLIDDYVKQNEAEPLCLSIVDSRLMEELVSEFERCFSQLSSIDNPFRLQLDSINRIANGEYVDLIDLMSAIRLEGPRGVIASTERIEKLLGDIVIRNDHNRDLFNGISVWMPTEVRNFKIHRYSDLKFASKVPSYIRFLQSYARMKT